MAVASFYPVRCEVFEGSMLYHRGKLVVELGLQRVAMRLLPELELTQIAVGPHVL